MTGAGTLALAFAPGFQEAASIIGWICLAIVGLAALGLAIFGIFRLATPERNMRGLARNGFPASAGTDEPRGLKPASTEAEPALTAQPIIVTPDLRQEPGSREELQFEKSRS